MRSDRQRLKYVNYTLIKLTVIRSKDLDKVKCILNGFLNSYLRKIKRKNRIFGNYGKSLVVF